MIEAIFGPMFSGKTSELMRKIKRHKLARKKCVVINYKNDNRYSSEGRIVSHDKLSIPASKVSRLCEVPKALLLDAEVVGVDEGQFFPDLIEYAEKWANEGKIVIVAALDATFQMKPFNKVTDLLSVAESVMKLKAVCMDCGKDASFTKRLSSEDEIELIAGLDKYKPVCRKCFFAEDPITPKKVLSKKLAEGCDFSAFELDKENKTPLTGKNVRGGNLVAKKGRF